MRPVLFILEYKSDLGPNFGSSGPQYCTPISWEVELAWQLMITDMADDVHKLWEQNVEYHALHTQRAYSVAPWYKYKHKQFTGIKSLDPIGAPKTVI